MIYDKLVILTNLFFEKYPEVIPFAGIEKIENSTPRFKGDWDKIYEQLSTQKEKNSLIKFGMPLNKRVFKFIEKKYSALIEIDRYYIYLFSDDIQEKDLHDMNKTYRKLKE